MTMKLALRVVFCVAGISAMTGCPQGGGALKVEKLEPAQGTTAGGEEITILGDGFQPGKTQAEVRFGRKKAEIVTIASTNKIKAVTPSGDKGPIDITVSFDDGHAFKVANGFRYVEPNDGESARKAFFSGSKTAGSKIELEKK